MNVNEAEKIIAGIGISSSEVFMDRVELSKALQTISDEISDFAKRASIEFGDLDTERWWESESPPYTYTHRLVIKKHDDVWGIFVEATQATPEHWEGSNHVGWAEPFGEAAKATGLVETFSLEFYFKETPYFIFQFLEDYCKFLKGQHVKYQALLQLIKR